MVSKDFSFICKEADSIEKNAYIFCYPRHNLEPTKNSHINLQKIPEWKFVPYFFF